MSKNPDAINYIPQEFRLDPDQLEKEFNEEAVLNLSNSFSDISTDEIYTGLWKIGGSDE